MTKRQCSIRANELLEEGGYEWTNTDSGIRTCITVNGNEVRYQAYEEGVLRADTTISREWAEIMLRVHFEEEGKDYVRYR